MRRGGSKRIQKKSKKWEGPWFVILIKYHLGHQIKKNEISGARGKCTGEENRVLVGKRE